MTAGAQIQQSTSASRLPVINGLRGMAILAVVYQHTLLTGLAAYAKGFAVMSIPLSVMLFKQGWIGVNLFFILSGFVLYLPYYSKKRDFNSAGAVQDFYQRRFTRLLPLFFINCFVCAFVAMRYQPFWFESFWPTITTLSMFSDVQWFPTINPALWSLIIEIYFGLLCPFLVLALDRLGWKKVSTVAFIAAFAIRLIGAQSRTTCIENSVLARLDDFLLGMVLCRVYFQNGLKGKPLLMLGAGLLTLTAGVALCDMRDASMVPPIGSAAINNVLQLGFFLIILSALRVKGLIMRALTSYPLQLLGMMCYSIYIWHLVMVEPVLGQWQSHPIRILNYALYLLAFSALSYRYIEFGAEKNWKKLFTPPALDNTRHGGAHLPLPLVQDQKELAGLKR